MQLNNKHLFSFLLHRGLRKLLKSKGITETQFELLVLCKYIYERSSRPVYIKDIQILLYNTSWRAYSLVYGLEQLDYINIHKRPQKWAGKARIEVSLAPLGNELLEKVRLASESRIACIKHQLDSEKSLVNRVSKKRAKKVA